MSRTPQKAYVSDQDGESEQSFSTAPHDQLTPTEPPLRPAFEDGPQLTGSRSPAIPPQRPQQPRPAYSLGQENLAGAEESYDENAQRASRRQSRSSSCDAVVAGGFEHHRAAQVFRRLQDNDNSMANASRNREEKHDRRPSSDFNASHVRSRPTETFQRDRAFEFDSGSEAFGTRAQSQGSYSEGSTAFTNLPSVSGRRRQLEGHGTRSHFKDKSRQENSPRRPNGQRPPSWSTSDDVNSESQYGQGRLPPRSFVHGARLSFRRGRPSITDGVSADGGLQPSGYEITLPLMPRAPLLQDVHNEQRFIRLEQRSTELAFQLMAARVRLREVERRLALLEKGSGRKDRGMGREDDYA